MSKQSKQERAQKYAEGAQEAVRLAHLDAEKTAAEVAGLHNSLNSIVMRVAQIAQWQQAAVAEAEVINTEIRALLVTKTVTESAIRDLENRVNGAKGTLHETAQRIHMMLAEVPAE